MKNQFETVEHHFFEEQKVICEKYHSGFITSSFDKMIAIAISSFEEFKMPINGLRHPIENPQVSNWYIWAGEYSDDEDFFQNIHIGHLLEICPKALKYLGLAPGWRFLFDNQYEDVWFDKNLLIV